jgi:hypothetical protein
MDVFKLAFETTVVGLLTMSWLTVAIYLLLPDSTINTALGNLQTFLKTYPTPLGIGAVTLAYCLGSAVVPVANQLVNDEHWPLNESAIRCLVLTRQDDNLKSAVPATDYTPLLPDKRPTHCSYWGPIFEKKIGPGTRVATFFRLWIGCDKEGCDFRSDASGSRDADHPILTIFEQQEAEVMNQGSDRTERLRQLHERIVVLRGMVFCGFVLSLICLLAYFARVNGTSTWIRPTCGIMLGVAFSVFAAFNGYNDLRDFDVFDIPVLESLLVVVTVFGVVLAIRKAKNKHFRSMRYVFVALFFTALAYGGWISSEATYDQQIISSFVASQKGSAAPRVAGDPLGKRLD